jgi:hypothetical protein
MTAKAQPGVALSAPAANGAAAPHCCRPRGTCARALLLLLALAACSDDVATRRTLEASGFTEIRTLPKVTTGCGEHDFYWTGFEATNPRGQRVKGTVCCGAFVKGCTVRF